MEKEERRTAKERLITLMQAGHSWHEAAALTGVQIGRSAAYHLLRNVHLRGGAALQDGRHGHPAKLRERPVGVFLTVGYDVPYNYRLYGTFTLAAD